MKWYWKLTAHLKDYCSNCTLAGFNYIANTNLHIIERLFWAVCIIFSTFCCYMLISQYQHDFNDRAVSIVYENLPSTQKVQFPTIAVCETDDKKDLSPLIDDYIKDYSQGREHIEDFVKFIIMPEVYNARTFREWCKIECDDCSKCEKCLACPPGDYRRIYEKVYTKCEDMLESCEFSTKPFDCCKYFLPLITPLGNCFMMNSLLNNARGSATWYNTIIEPFVDVPTVVLKIKKFSLVSVWNAEDLPNGFLPSNKFSLAGYNVVKKAQIFIQNMVNDHDVRDLEPEYRQCRFPDELLPNTAYKAYSFTTCFLDCTRQHQLRVCNCTPFVYLPQKNKNIPECNLEGLQCLEVNRLMRPDPSSLLQWKKSNYPCKCLPSCEEQDIKIVYEDARLQNIQMNEITISMPEYATVRYRRQSLRAGLDVVVTIGGILGLFLGASILSGIEFVYYFTIRIVNNIRMERAEQLEEERQLELEQNDRREIENTDNYSPLPQHYFPSKRSGLILYD